MHEIPNIITERVDDIPLLIEQMQRMGLPTLLDNHFPTHGNWTGLSLGWVSTIWLSSMLSRGDHRMVHVEPWVAKRLWTLRVTTGQAVRRVDFTDDRLEIVLRRLSDDTRWAAFESALNQHTVRVYDLSTARVHVDSTSASVYATVSEGGLFQFGHSKDDRPDLSQVKVMQAVLDPLGMPLATDVVSGERADDPLYMPCIERVQASVGRHGLLYVGDCKMASRDTRARIAAAGDFYLCPLVAKAMAQIEALNQRGRGKKRFETVSAFRQAVVAIVQHYSVEDLLWFRLTQHNIPRPVRAYRGQPARVDHDRHTTVEVRVDEAALEATIRRLGWRVYGTNQPVASLSLAQAVLAYRSEYQ